VADVSYWSGNICDNWGNHVHSIQGGRGMHALGTYALVHALMSSLNGCLDCCDDLLLLAMQWCGGCSAGLVTAGKPAAVTVIEVLGY